MQNSEKADFYPWRREARREKERERRACCVQAMTICLRLAKLSRVTGDEARWCRINSAGLFDFALNYFFWIEFISLFSAVAIILE
jgi:hypothetical protein